MECSAGTCVPVCPNPAEDYCDQSGCQDLQASEEACGECGHACESTVCDKPSCQSGSCQSHPEPEFSSCGYYGEQCRSGVCEEPDWRCVDGLLFQPGVGQVKYVSSCECNATTQTLSYVETNGTSGTLTCVFCKVFLYESLDGQKQTKNCWKN